MDPEATWRELFAALQAKDWDVVRERVDALLLWLQKDGAPPCTVGPRELGVDWHRSITWHVCLRALGLWRQAMKTQAEEERRG